MISGADVQQLTDILAGKAMGETRGERLTAGASRPTTRRQRPAVHCPECGFMNNPGANFCQKCGAHLPADERDGDQTTITYKVGETGELQAGRRRAGGVRRRRARDPLRRRPCGGELLASRASG